MSVTATVRTDAGAERSSVALTTSPATGRMDRATHCSRIVPPLPLVATRFPVSRAAEAMRLFSKAQHIGKVVLTFDEPAVEVEIDLAQPMRFSTDASYLVTGGLRGFGGMSSK